MEREPLGSDVEKELEATVAARRELGAEHDEQLIAGFLERIDREIDRRVAERVARRGPRLPVTPAKETLGVAVRVFAVVGVLVVAVPVLAVAGFFGGGVGVIAALIALAVIVARLSVSRR